MTTTTEVRVMLKRADAVAPWMGTVRYTAEPYSLTGRPRKGVIRERDVLGSRHALDLNGDGDTKDRFGSGCDEAGFSLGKTLRLDPVMTGPAGQRRYAYAADDGQTRIGSLGNRGASAMLYLACADDGTVSLGWSPRPIEVREIAGPALMVLAFGNPTLAPSIPTDGVSRTPERDGLAEQRFDIEVFEPVVQQAHWYAVAGAMVQVDPDAQEQEIRVFFDGDIEHVQIALNEGNDAVDRARSYVSTQTIGSR
ncbi:MAG: hypothetical protein ACRBN8_34680 [Nannocystales bacterium]